MLVPILAAALAAIGAFLYPTATAIYSVHNAFDAEAVKRVGTGPGGWASLIMTGQTHCSHGAVDEYSGEIYAWCWNDHAPVLSAWPPFHVSVKSDGNQAENPNGAPHVFLINPSTHQTASLLDPVPPLSSLSVLLNMETHQVASMLGLAFPERAITQYTLTRSSGWTPRAKKTVESGTGGMGSVVAVTAGEAVADAAYEILALDRTGLAGRNGRVVKVWGLSTSADPTTSKPPSVLLQGLTNPTALTYIRHAKKTGTLYLLDQSGTQLHIYNRRSNPASDAETFKLFDTVSLPIVGTHIAVHPASNSIYVSGILDPVSSLVSILNPAGGFTSSSSTPITHTWGVVKVAKNSGEDQFLGRKNAAKVVYASKEDGIGSVVIDAPRSRTILVVGGARPGVKVMDGLL
ncbi:hypothetical protein DFS34DRAFT_119418 [Phlyctochytrium arcticum]|nr:hypothetical protein DFS34DRAFT_119418 [Phlyctochytrium arcticum]